jgi:hypothetical protein
MEPSVYTPNEIVETATMRSGNLDAQRYIVDPKYYKPLMNLAAAGKYQRAFSRSVGLGETLGGPFIQTTEELPDPGVIIVTADAPIGATTLAVEDASLVRKFTRAAHKAGNQDIAVTEHPLSLTAITVAALTAPVNKGSVLQLHGIHPGEPHPRSKPKSRSTESHRDFTSKIYDSFSISYEMAHRKMWGTMEKIRLQGRFSETSGQDLNRVLYFDKRKDGSADGVWMTNGLFSQGFDFGYVPVPGTLTPDILFDAVYKLKKYGNARGSLEFISGQRIIKSVAQWASRSGIERSQPGDKFFGANRIEQINVPVDDITNVRHVLDMTFDEKDWDDVALLIAWDNVYPIRGFADFIQPESQDNGVGQEQFQVTRFPGWKYPMPGGDVILFSGINDVRAN